MMQDVKLVDVAQQMVGKNMLPVAYKAALGDTKYRDLDGKVQLTFPTSHVQPYQGGGCLLACFARRALAPKGTPWCFCTTYCRLGVAAAAAKCPGDVTW
jgi:hypothetical protein